MAGMGPPPKPGAIRRSKPTFEWVELPSEGRKGPPPPLPKWRNWHAGTKAEWTGWWSTPQATRWDQTGRSLLRWALLFDRLMAEADCPVSVHTQIQVLEDRHGFSEKAMLNLRWRIKKDEVGEKREQRAATPAGEAKQVASRMRRVK